MSKKLYLNWCKFNVRGLSVIGYWRTSKLPAWMKSSFFQFGQRREPVLFHTRIQMRVAGQKLGSSPELLKKSGAHLDVVLLVPAISLIRFELCQWFENDREGHFQIALLESFALSWEKVTPGSSGLARWCARRARNSARWASVTSGEFASLSALPIKACPKACFSAALRCCSACEMRAFMVADWHKTRLRAPAGLRVTCLPRQ